MKPILSAILTVASVFAQDVNWTARWIAAPGAPKYDFGVYHFRRSFHLAVKPESFVVHVSGDNRYQLFVNGKRVSAGPARGDILHWRYETVDLAPQLRIGNNAIAAVVWNAGAEGPIAQNSNETGFLLQGATDESRQLVNSDKRWKCLRDVAYSPLPVRAGRDVIGYFAAGPGERVDGAVYPWEWQDTGFDDSAWPNAIELDRASARGGRDAHSPWMLVPRPIPPEEETLEPPLKARVGPSLPFRVEPNSTARVILDQGYYTTGYPELTVTGGKGAEVRLRYAESLFEKGKSSKGNRNEVEGKDFRGYADQFVPDGGARRFWRPLWWRTWRYIELTVKTDDHPISIDSLNTVFTGYPFVRRAKLTTPDEKANAELQRMLDVSWRTLRVDAHETFMDCAYYEQLQYIGDTRLEALAAYTMSGDARLVRNAIVTLQETQTADGLTQSRGPSRLSQYIPPFSMLWIGMLHDYWMYRDDPALVREMLPASRAILSWFAARRKANGALGALPWWNYVDWVRKWPNGVPPRGDAGGSAVVDLIYLNALRWAGDMESAMGSKAVAEEYSADAARLATAIQADYWDSSRGLYADTADRKEYSQHANSLAILAGLIKGDEARRVAAKLIDDPSLTGSTLYFRYYVHTALRETGLGDRFLDLLGTWRDALAVGLETWPEMPEPSRSDAHAWSSHISIDMFRTMLGIRPAAPGFARVTIEPYLGKLERLSGTMPHPKGEIAVSLDKRAGTAEIDLPAGVSGELIWNGKQQALNPGRNTIR